MAYKKDALPNLGMVDPTKFINPIGMVNPNRVAEIPAASNTGNPTIRPVFDDTTQGAANYAFGPEMDRQKSMSSYNSAPLVKTGMPEKEPPTSDSDIVIPLAGYGYSKGDVVPSATRGSMRDYIKRKKDIGII